MSIHAQIALLIPLAYLAGSIPFGLLVGRAKGVDVRKSGSGNIGATNVARVLGHKRWFWVVFFLDMLKSLLPMLLAATLLRDATKTTGLYALWLGIGFAAVLGHMFSVFLKFKGGKGVATSAGVLLGLWPYYTIPGILTIIVFFIVFLIWRYISLASIAAAAAFPVLYVTMGVVVYDWPVFGKGWPLLLFTILISGLVIHRHRTNITRLRAGTETRFGQKP